MPYMDPMGMSPRNNRKQTCSHCMTFLNMIGMTRDSNTYYYMALICFIFFYTPGD